MTVWYIDVALSIFLIPSSLSFVGLTATQFQLLHVIKNGKFFLFLRVIIFLFIIFLYSWYIK